MAEPWQEQWGGGGKGLGRLELGGCSDWEMKMTGSLREARDPLGGLYWDTESSGRQRGPTYAWGSL